MEHKRSFTQKICFCRAPPPAKSVQPLPAQWAGKMGGRDFLSSSQGSNQSAASFPGVRSSFIFRFSTFTPHIYHMLICRVAAAQLRSAQLPLKTCLLQKVSKLVKLQITKIASRCRGCGCPPGRVQARQHTLWGRRPHTVASHSPVGQPY